MAMKTTETKWMVALMTCSLLSAPIGETVLAADQLLKESVEVKESQSDEAKTALDQDNTAKKETEGDNSANETEKDQAVPSDSDKTAPKELTEELKQNPYFPKEPTQEDIEGAYVEPGDIAPPPAASIYGKRSRGSSINDEIIRGLNSGVFKKTKIEFRHNTIIDRFSYNDGVGKPRGIVIHETANPNSTIENEIAYMLNNWRSAFVHAYTDKSKIIEVHPTDYAAWGAGPVANQYFMHIELVEHPGDQQGFLQSVSNDAYYAAYKLKEYNLVPSRAYGKGEGNFGGTVWSHHEVSSYLGGTNHTDPTGYFAKFNYDMGQFFELLLYHYNQIDADIFDMDESYTSYGEIVKDDKQGIYSDPYNSINAEKVGDEATYLHKKVSITGKATNKRTKQVYYQFSYEGKKIGWLEASLFHELDQVEYNKAVDFEASVKSQSETSWHGIYDGIYNTETNVNEIGKGSQYANKAVHIKREAKTKHATWYLFELAGKEIGWMDSRAFNNYQSISYDKEVKFDKKVAKTGPITDDIPNTHAGIQVVDQLKNYTGDVLAVAREAKTGEGIWYQVKANGQVLGWASQAAFSDPDKIYGEKPVHYEQVDVVDEQASVYNKILGTSSDVKEVGKVGDFNTKYASLMRARSAKQISALNVVKEARTDAGLWYELANKQDKKIGWVESQAISIPNRLEYRAHVRNKGWLPYVSAGDLSGTTGENRPLEAFSMNLKDTKDLDISYRAHVQNVGWMSWAKNGEIGGTVGQAQHVEAMSVKLTGKEKDNYDVYYRVHAKNFGWLDWAKNGENAGTQGYNYHIESYEVEIVPKGEKAPGKTDRPFVVAPPTVRYQAHVKNVGWQGPKTNGATSGTVGEAKHVEAIRAGLTNRPFSGSIRYQAYAQNKGWLEPVDALGNAGTSGENRPLEAFKMELTGEIAKHYDIYYRAHSATYGWLGWAKNGASAGTVTLAKQLEAYQVQILPKDAKEPESGDLPPLLGKVVANNPEDKAELAQVKFMNKILPDVQKVAPNQDLFSSVMIAQAVLESASGTSTLALPPNYNLFGIKGEYEGQYVELPTLEQQTDGEWITIVAKFKKYPSYRESFKDNAYKLKNGVSWDANYYRGAWRSVAKTYPNATKWLTGRYATDQHYNEKLDNLIKKWYLNQFD